jgi:hypothetical protein
VTALFGVGSEIAVAGYIDFGDSDGGPCVLLGFYDTTGAATPEDVSFHRSIASLVWG